LRRDWPAEKRNRRPESKSAEFTSEINSEFSLSVHPLMVLGNFSRSEWIVAVRYRNEQGTNAWDQVWGKTDHRHWFLL
jgi:hypothetical protein